MTNNDNTNEEIKKKVDGAWKDSVAKEKAAEQAPKEPEIKVSFEMFISGLMMEGLVALGEAENPISKKKEFNGMHAKFLIETVDMLKEKTKNNLDKNETDMIEAVLYELKMRFVNKAATAK